MIVALIDNGSLEPAAHQNLRRVAVALTRNGAPPVQAVSWKHSDRIPAESLEGAPAWTLKPFVRAAVARGEREFVFIPFFISAQGAIGSALRDDLDALRSELGGFDFTFTDGLANGGALARILTEHIRSIITLRGLKRPPVIVVDHGGPSRASADLRDGLAADVRHALGDTVGPMAAASMEGDHPPLLADQLQAHGFAGSDVVVALLFLSPGRHAGPSGDIAEICRASPARCHLTDLIGSHPLAVATLAAALHQTLSNAKFPSLA